jgi:hypothetical protein
MPALPDYPNVLKVVHRFQSGADADVACSWHFGYTGTAPSNSTCDAIAAAVLAGAVTNFLPVMSDDVQLTGVTVQDLTSATAGAGESLGAHTGTRSGGPLPAAACVLINQPIARRYRGGKPRTYWPFGAAGDVASTQDWVSGSLTDFTAAIQLQLDVILAIVESGTTISDWVSISYYEGFTAVLNPITGRTRDVPKVRTAAIAPDVINTFLVNPKVASQRRRNLH